jgi:hypothetical protein
LPHQKKQSPRAHAYFEKAPQINADYPELLVPGCQNGVNHERETGGNRGIHARYRKAAKKDQSAIPAEFTRLTGYRRKSAVRILGGRPLGQR